ncbi:hypothetical protein KIH32_06390 [Pseudomonas fluorescens]|uniref:hypothetical protein n=1 Tax=Pseudomonas fluorescens TaxID=294 RepID=UPI001BDB0B0F|nr:hypothetical protein [Pseudomonas fluorescens]MBT0623525.1 hypothetical protein [Pseudomonas fluorescens]
MVWQRAGTVAVQTGSTTVVGTNVDFAASSRNGDSFVGPDGATYEVANVASSTVISILPAYKGPTVSGAAYAIMPVQGYDKMLSDAFNNLNNQFGPKLAALGTTGNYDTLPIFKGGTAATTQAQACSNLGALRNQAANSTIGLSFGSAAPPNIASIDSSGNNANTALRISNIGNTSASAVMSFYRDGQFGVHFGIDTDNQLKLGGASYGANAYRIYHEGNTTRAADGTLKAI